MGRIQIFQNLKKGGNLKKFGGRNQKGKIFSVEKVGHLVREKNMIYKGTKSTYFSKFRLRQSLISLFSVYSMLGKKSGGPKFLEFEKS